MIILGLDQNSKRCGVAIWDTACRLETILAFSLAIAGDTSTEKVDSFHRQFVDAVRKHKPDYAAFEEPLPNIPDYEVEVTDIAGSYAKRAVNAKSSLVLNRIAGSAQSILMGFRVPYESVSPETWRKSFLGYGRKKGFKKQQYKKAAKDQCRTERIAISNEDEAEAAGIAFWCGRASQKLKMMQARAA